MDDSNLLTNENFTYKIIKNRNDYTLEESDGESVETSEDDYTLEIVETEQGIELVSTDRLTKF